MVCEIIFLKKCNFTEINFSLDQKFREVKTQQEVSKYSQSPNNINIKILRSKSLIEVSNITYIYQI